MLFENPCYLFNNETKVLRKYIQVLFTMSTFSKQLQSMYYISVFPYFNLLYPDNSLLARMHFNFTSLFSVSR